MTLKVLVSGAGGRTGRLVFQKLQSSPDFDAQGLVRDTSKTSEALGSSEGLLQGDITNMESLKPALEGKDALVVLTSAVPQIVPAAPDAPPGPPTFTFADGGTPEEVDWAGARNQIDVAKSFGVSQIVFVGSMGGTDDNHPLNRIGNGNILRFKRRAEKYLIESGVPYTIINPAGLTNDDEGMRELVVGSNDELFSVFGAKGCTVPRGDVARVVVAALTSSDAKNKAMDLVARPSGDGHATVEPSSLFAQTGPDL